MELKATCIQYAMNGAFKANRNWKFEYSLGGGIYEYDYYVLEHLIPTFDSNLGLEINGLEDDLSDEERPVLRKSIDNNTRLPQNNL